MCNPASRPDCEILLHYYIHNLPVVFEDDTAYSQAAHLEHLFFLATQVNKDSMREWPLLCAISTVEVPSSSTCSTFALASHNDWTISRKPFLWSPVAVGGWQRSTGSTYWRTRTLKIFRGMIWMMHFERLVLRQARLPNIALPRIWAATKSGVAPSFPARLRSELASTKTPQLSQFELEMVGRARTKSTQWWSSCSEQSAVELFNGDRYDALTHFETTHEWSQLLAAA